MKVFFLFSFVFSFFFATLVHAEYRVFVLKITKPSQDKTLPPASRTIQSSLDPTQYRGYYPVASDEQIEYVDTWMCKGRTGDFQDYCPKPADPSSQKAQIQDPAVSNQIEP